MDKLSAMQQRAPRVRRRQRASEGDQDAQDSSQHVGQSQSTAATGPSPLSQAQKHPDTAVDDSGVSRKVAADASHASAVGAAIPVKKSSSSPITVKQPAVQRDSRNNVREKKVKVFKPPRSPRQHEKTELVHFNSYMQVVSTDACGMTPCIFLRAGHRRYVFNASEGLQRVLGHYKLVSLPKVDAYMITRVSTSTLAGLPGILMGSNVVTQAAASLLGDTQAVTVYGPPTLDDYVKTFLPYVINAVSCNVEELAADGAGVALELPPVVTTQELTVTPIMVRPFASGTQDPSGNTHVEPNTSGTAAAAAAAASVAADDTATVSAVAGGATRIDATSAAADEAAVAAGNGLAQSSAPMEVDRGQQAESASGADKGGDAGVKEEGAGEAEQRPQKKRRMEVSQGPPPTRWKASESSVCYVAKLLDRPGKFNPKKAAALGVPRGPLYGELQKGQAVVGANGRLVQPLDVLEPGTPGPLLVILDCPSLGYLPSYAHAPLLQPHLGLSTEQGSSSLPLVVVAHVGSRDVVQHPEYQQWLRKWGSHCHHMLPAHPSGADRPTYLHRATMLQAKLNSVAPSVFPLPAGIEHGPPATGSDAMPAATQNTTAPGLIASTTNGSGTKSGPSIHHAGVCTKFTLYPPQQAGLDVSLVPELLDVTAVQKEFLDLYNTPVAAAPEITRGQGQGKASPAPTTADSSLQNTTAPQASNATKVATSPMDAGAADGAAASQPAAQLNDVDEPSGGAEKGSRAKETAEKAGVSKENGVEAANCSVPGHTAGCPGDAKQETEQAVDQEEVPECVRNALREEAEVVFLGTASAMPGTYRNVSGTLVNLFDRGCLLVDCGEDSWTQVRRRYGEEGAVELMKRLQCVWISHMHADHHGGLYPLLQVRRRLLGRRAPPLLIIGPHSLGRVLYNYHNLMPMRYAFLPSTAAEKDEVTAPQLPPQTLEAVKRVKAALQLSSLRTFPVDHGCAAHGLQLHSQRGWRLVFSGDTQPCGAVERAAEGATLLVHEATFEDALVHEARMRRHCTISEALQVARKASAYRCVLTHFSQRYPKMPSAHKSGAMDQAFFAFDHATINLVDLPRLPKLIGDWGHLCKCLSEDDQEVPAGKE